MSALAERLSIGNPSYNDPFRPALWGLAAVLAFVLMFVVWGYVAPLSSAAIAEGSLQVEAHRQSVQHPYGGIIEKIFVTEGQHVERGQLLVKLDDTEARAKLDVADAEVVALLAQQERLICERDETCPAALDEFGRKNQSRMGMNQAVANERAVMMARSRQYEVEKGMLTSKIAQLNEKITGLKAQISGLSHQSDLIQEELEGARRLFSSGFGPKTRVLTLERTLAQILADRGSRMADLAETEQAVSAAELGIAKQERDHIMDITTQLRQTQSDLAEALPKLDAARDVLKRTVIRAPMGGSIVGLSVFTEGGVAEAGARLMDIVPTDDPMIVDARLPLYDVNDVRPGFVADIHLTGVPRNERPQLTGEVISVSADKITDPASGASYFSVRVRLDPDDVKQSKVGLQPGMPAEVVVATKSRTLASYLLGPLLDEIGRGFHEN